MNTVCPVGPVNEFERISMSDVGEPVSVFTGNAPPLTWLNWKVSFGCPYVVGKARTARPTLGGIVNVLFSTVTSHHVGAAGTFVGPPRSITLGTPLPVNVKFNDLSVTDP